MGVGRSDAAFEDFRHVAGAQVSAACSQGRTGRAGQGRRGEIVFRLGLLCADGEEGSVSFVLRKRLSASEIVGRSPREEIKGGRQRAVSLPDKRHLRGKK